MSDTTLTPIDSLPEDKTSSRAATIQLFKTALKEAGWVFLVSRLTILVASYIVVALLPQFVMFQEHATHFLACAAGIRPNPCYFAWFHGDAIAYARIAYQGYASPSDAAFFPLWPLMIHAGGLLLGGFYPLSYYLAGVLLSNLAFFAVLVVFYCLLAGDFDASVARRVLFYLAFYPYAIFFFIGYGESLALLLSLGVFLLLRRGRAWGWWLAGVLGFLETLERSSGMLVAVPFLVLYIQCFWLPGKREQSSLWQKARALAPILLIPSGMLVYMLYLWQTKGNPLFFQVEEVANWHRYLDFFAVPILSAIRGVLIYPHFSYGAILNMLDVIFVAIPVAALVLGWRHLPLHYSLFALVSMLFSLSLPIHESFNPLASQPRYMMAAFPIFVVFALWGKHTRFNQAYVAFAPALLTLATMFFVIHYWVA